MNGITNGIVNYSFIPDSKMETDFIDDNTRETTEDWKNEKDKIPDLASSDNKIRNKAGVTVFEEEGSGMIVTQTSDSESTAMKKGREGNITSDNSYLSSITDEKKNILPKEPESDELESPETSIDISIFEDSFTDKTEKHEKSKEKNNNLLNTNKESDKIRTNDTKLNLNDNEDLTFKFVGSTYRSLREEPRKSSWRRRSLYDSVRRKRPKQDELLDFSILKPEPELSRSQYSLVSTGELTAEALQVWKELPKKIKYDPEMAPFQQRYEKVYGKPETIHLKAKNGSIPETKRLPLVKSAPHLNNNIRVVDDVPYIDGKPGVEVQDPMKNDSRLEHGAIQTRSSKFALARHYIKMTMLLACWIFFTLVFLLYNEKEEIYRNSSVNPGEVKSYILNVTESRLSIQVKLLGPFLSEQGEGRMNFSEIEASHKMLVWLERWTLVDGWTDAVSEADAIDKEASNPWTIVLQDDEDLDFSKGEPRSTVISLKTNWTQSNNTVYALKMGTTAMKTTPFTMTYTLNPLDISTGVIYACLLLCGLYVLIIFEIINRTMAAVLISTTALATLAIVGERPTLPQLVSWLDMETLLLLFSMMLLVAIMAETGMFDFLAVFTFEVTKGKLWPLITLLCIITAFLSTFLDNVTTVLLMTPVTIRLCEVMDLDPVPILMSMVLYSNIGGTATPVGDPPNVIIASNRAIVQAGINFTNFTMHMTLGILVVCVQTYFQLRYIYRDTNKLRSNVPREIQDLRHQISIWRRAIESLPHLSKDQHVVRERLERKMKKLNVQLETMIKETNKRICPKETFQSTLADLKQKYKIRDKMLLFKSTIAIGFVVVLFFLHSIPELNRVSLGWTALLGAILLLTLADREDLEPILHRVEWSTLLFFASLFVLMEALSKLGLIEFIGGLTESLILRVDEKARLAVALLLMLWVSGVTSAFVDNIPLTTMMVRVVIALGSNPNLNLPMAPLIWALSFGACLGGNGTLIGASANVVCAGVAEQHGYRFTFMQFFKVGFPIMIGHLIVASGYLLLCHCVFTWH